MSRAHVLTRRKLGVGLVAGLAVGLLLALGIATGGAPAGGAPDSASRLAHSAFAAGSVPGGDWPTFGADAQHSGAFPGASGITRANLGRLTLRRVTIDGIVDGSAIELHVVRSRGRTRDVIALTTTYGRTIALDARTGSRLWEFRPAHVNSRPGNPQVTNAAPVADPDRRYLYAASPDGVVHKLAVADGRQAWRTPISFDGAREKIASALTVSRRFVVAVTGGYIGDIPPYDGHVVTLERSSGRIVHVFNGECSNLHRLIRASSCSVTNARGDNAIWARAGAVIEPGSGRILVATGNGPFDGATSWGDSVLELSPDAGRLLHNWTPANQAALARSDTDVGSAAPTVLPAYHGRRLLVQTGKDGQLHLLDLGALDGGSGGAGSRLGGQLQNLAAPGGGAVFTAPAVWRDAQRVLVFVANDAGTEAYELFGAPHPRLRMVWQDATGGTSPVEAGGLLYVYDQRSGSLNVRQARSGALLRSLPVATGHWNSPIVVGGRIILPTGTYFASSSSSTVEIYHLPGR